MTEDSNGPQHLDSDNDLVSIEEDEVDTPSSSPIDTELPTQADPESEAPSPAEETKKAEALEAWKRRYSDDGGV